MRVPSLDVDSDVGPVRYRPVARTFRLGTGMEFRKPDAREAWIVARLAVALKKLADLSADDIAYRLAWDGVTGECGDSKKCAGAVWLQKEIGWGDVRLSHRTTAFFDGLAASYETPPSLAEFYTAFDAKQYPNLITSKCDCSLCPMP